MAVPSDRSHHRNKLFTKTPRNHTTTTAANRRAAVVLAVLAVGLAAISVGRLWIGSGGVGWPSGDILDVRLHRLALGLIVGAALSVSGVALQSLLRNPLAEPYILGLSTGAGAGIMVQSFLIYLVVLSGADHQVGTLGANHVGAVVGAAVSMSIVFLASRRRSVIDPVGLLLIGVVLSTVNGALIMMLNYLVGPGGIRDDLMRWMMGYLNEGVGRPTLWIVALLTIGSLTGLLAVSRAMDIATLSDTEAQSLGVNLARLRTILFLVASVLAAGAVVLAGPIAFVGLICPHLARLLLGPRHGALLLGAAMVGASLILLADVASALIHLGLRVGLMPIGIFTAMVGGPLFLWMLRPHLGRPVP